MPHYQLKRITQFLECMTVASVMFHNVNMLIVSLFSLVAITLSSMETQNG
jgi:hypothetical protein